MLRVKNHTSAKIACTRKNVHYLERNVPTQYFRGFHFALMQKNDSVDISRSYNVIFNLNASQDEKTEQWLCSTHRVFPCFFFCFFFTFDESKLSDVVAVIGGVDDVGVFQLARLNQHVVDLR